MLTFHSNKISVSDKYIRFRDISYLLTCRSCIWFTDCLLLQIVSSGVSANGIRRAMSGTT